MGPSREFQPPSRSVDLRSVVGDAAHQQLAVVRDGSGDGGGGGGRSRCRAPPGLRSAGHRSDGQRRRLRLDAIVDHAGRSPDGPLDVGVVGRVLAAEPFGRRRLRRRRLGVRLERRQGHRTERRSVGPPSDIQRLRQLQSFGVGDGRRRDVRRNGISPPVTPPSPGLQRGLSLSSGAGVGGRRRRHRSQEPRQRFVAVLALRQRRCGLSQLQFGQGSRNKSSPSPSRHQCSDIVRILLTVGLY